MINSEYIRLSFPVNPAYVSSARLTVSSIANRIRFDIDEIEDLKTAVSEACTYIIKQSSRTDENFEICFMPKMGEMTVEIVAYGNNSEDGLDGDLSLMMIKALVDEFNITKPEKGKFTITMVKKHKESIFN